MRLSRKYIPLCCVLLSLLASGATAQFVPYASSQESEETILLVETSDWTQRSTYELMSQEKFDKLQAEIRNEAALCREALKLAEEEWTGPRNERRRFPKTSFGLRKAVIIGRFTDRTKAMTARLEAMDKEQQRVRAVIQGNAEREATLADACSLFQAKLSELLYKKDKTDQQEKTIGSIPPARGAAKEPDGLVFRVRGGTMKIQVCEENVIRVVVGPGNVVPARANSIVSAKWSAPAWRTESTVDFVAVVTAKLQARVMLASGAISFCDVAGKLLLAEAPNGRSILALDGSARPALTARLELLMARDETISGVDSSSTRESPLSGALPILQKNTLNANPVLVSTRGYAVLLDNAGHMMIDAGATEEGNVGDTVPAGCLLDTAGRQGGLSAEYFNDMRLLDRKTARYEPWTGTFDWQYGSPVAGLNPDAWGARWTGFILTGLAGTYSFTANADDGARLWINDTLVIDAWQAGHPKGNSGKVTLPAHAMVPFRMEYYDAQQLASVQLIWKPPAQRDRRLVVQADSAEALDYYFVYGATAADSAAKCLAVVSKPVVTPPPAAPPPPPPALEPPPPAEQTPPAPAVEEKPLVPAEPPPKPELPTL